MKYKNFIRNFLVTTLALVFIGCGSVNSRLTDSDINSRLERLALHAKKNDNDVCESKGINENREIGRIKYTDLNFKGEVDSKDKIETWYGGDFYLLEYFYIPGFVHYISKRLDGVLEKDIVVYMGIPKDFDERKDFDKRQEKTLNRLEVLFDIKK